jgi:CspA family cold shock protein
MDKFMKNIFNFFIFYTKSKKTIIKNNIKTKYILYYNKMSDSSVEKFTGRVKWFNNKAGYGFITVTDGPKSGSDVFVHHSSIKVVSEQYKYLVQGEYVEFTLSTVAGDKHECQATDVSGIKGGKLMCETRNETRVAYKEASEPVKMPRSKPVPVDTNAGTKSDGAWTHVRSSKPQSKRPTTGGRGSPRGPVSGGRGRGQKRDAV